MKLSRRAEAMGDKARLAGRYWEKLRRIKLETYPWTYIPT
jgi:hypothetical protein